MNQFSTLTLDGDDLTAGDIAVGATDQLSGSGTINGDIVDNGTILAGVVSNPDAVFGAVTTDDLVINGAVSGEGVLEIAGGSQMTANSNVAVGGEIELKGASANDVVFAQGVGALRLDQPSAFTGAISQPGYLSSNSAYGPVTTTFELDLEGVSFASVTSYAYSGDTAGGVLSIDTTAGDYSYKFSGAFVTSEFSLSAEADDATPGLAVTVTPKPLITGTVAGQHITDTQTLRPFAGVEVSDSLAPNGASDTAYISISGGLGTWSNLGTGAGEYNYSVNGDPASITAALQGLVFTPTLSSETVGSPQTITFTVTYSDYLEPAVTNSTTTVVVTATTQNISQSGVTLYASNSPVSFIAPAAYDTVVGDDDTITAPLGMNLTVTGVCDAAYLSNGYVYLGGGSNVSTVGNGDAALAYGNGNGDVIGFVGVGDVAYIQNGEVYLGPDSNVVVVGDDDVANAGTPGEVMGFYGTGDVAEISNGTVYLGGRSNVVVVGADDVANAGAAGAVMGFVGTGDVAEISNGTVYLGGQSNVVIVGADDVANAGVAGAVMGFVGNGDVAEISSGTVYLVGSVGLTIEGGDDVVNTASAGAVMTFDGTNDVAEISNGTVNLVARSSVTVQGSDDLAYASQVGATMNFTGARDTAQISNGTVGLQNASAAIVGANDTVSLQTLFGVDTLSGFGASDQLQVSGKDFASASAVLSAAVQSGADTLITFDANDTLRLTNVSLSSLSASQITIL